MELPRPIGDFPGLAVQLDKVSQLDAQPARALGTFNTVLQEALSALGRIYLQLSVSPKVNSLSSAPNLKILKNKAPTIIWEILNIRWRISSSFSSANGSGLAG